MSVTIFGLGGKCLDIDGGDILVGKPLILWENHGGGNQQFVFDGNGRIANALQNDKFLGLGGPVANMTRIIVTDSINAQQWTYNADATITLKGTNFCIDVEGAADASGTHIILFDKHGGANQQWSLQSRVAGFKPSENGLHFPNSFIHAPDNNINILGLNVAIGDAANGLCGGMIYTVRDMFQAGVLPPPYNTSPTSGPLFDYIVKRLYDSFELPGGPVKYLHLMDPAFPDADVPGMKPGTVKHGRGWVMVQEEWPKIKADLDNGMLSTIALIEIKSANPGDLGKNHQVLAYGYTLKGDDLTINIYEPNCPDEDDKVLTLNLSNPANATMITNSCRFSPTPICFFRTAYQFSAPPAFPTLPPVQTGSVTITNRSDHRQHVRIFNAEDSLMLVALTAGEFDLDNNESGTWVFQPGISSVKITANNKTLGVFMAGNNVSIDSDERLYIINLQDESRGDVKVQFYNVHDLLRIATLPGGDPAPITWGAGDLYYTLPPDLEQVRVIFRGNYPGEIGTRGQNFSINADGSISHNP